MKKNKYLWLGAIVFDLLFFSACKDRLFDNPLDPNADKRAYEILATIPLSGIIPIDLTFSKDSLWVVDSLSRVMSLNYETGMVIRELSVEQRVNGIAYDGDGLWLTIDGTPQIIKINMIDGLVVRTLNFSRGDFGPMDALAGKLYIGDRLTNSVLVVDALNGNLEKSIPNPGFSLDGVAFDGTFFWTIDASQMRIYKLDADGKVIIYYQTPAKAGAGLSYTTGFMWTGDRSGKIYKLRFQ